MRIVSLVVLFTAAFYYFIPRDNTGPEIDILKVKVSAPDRNEEAPERLLTATELPPAKDFLPEEAAPPAGEVSELAPEADAVEEGEIEHYDDEDEAGVTDLEDGWNSQLKESLSYLEPEHGEEMYNAYMNERDTYQSDLDNLIRDNQTRQDLELLIDELEMKHEDRVKEIFGRHYEELKAQQAYYIESNASSAGLSP